MPLAHIAFDTMPRPGLCRVLMHEPPFMAFELRRRGIVLVHAGRHKACFPSRTRPHLHSVHETIKLLKAQRLDAVLQSGLAALVSRAGSPQMALLKVALIQGPRTMPHVEGHMRTQRHILRPLEHCAHILAA